MFAKTMGGGSNDILLALESLSRVDLEIAKALQPKRFLEIVKYRDEI